MQWTKRISCTRAVTGILLIGLTAMSVFPVGGAEPWPDDIKRIKERGELIVAQYRGVEPAFFFFADSREYPDQASYVYEGQRLVGCDIALAVGIADQLGVRLRLDRSAPDYDTVCRYVAQGKADLGISMLSITPRRAQYVRFSSSYAVARMGILVDRLHVPGLKGPHLLSALCHGHGTNMGILGGCSYGDVARRVCPRARLSYYPDFDTMLRKMMSGEIHALFDDEFQILTILHRHPERAVRLKFLVLPEVKDHIGVAVSPRCPNLLAFVNVVLGSDQVRSDLPKLLKLFTVGPGDRRTRLLSKDPQDRREADRGPVR